MRPRAGVVLAALALASGGSGRPAMAQPGDPLALAVKAAFLAKFPLYITWPEHAFAAAASPFTICIVGSHPFGPVIDRAVAGQSVGTHRLAVRRVASLPAGAACQIAYFAMSDTDQVRAALAPARHQPVLTVTDSIGDVGAAGVINFVTADDRVRFEIDVGAANRAGIVISSKLLRVALTVRPAA